MAFEAAKKYDYIRFTWPDFNGIPRGKVVARRNVQAFLKDGVNCYMGVVSLGPRSHVSTPDEVIAAHFGNCRYQPVPETLYDVAWAGNGQFRIGEVFCEPVLQDGSYFPVGPRYVARKQLDILKEMGYKLLSACEIEGRINAKDTGEPLFHGKDLYVQQVFAQQESLLLNLDRMVEKAGINIADMHAEWGSGQFEWALEPCWGLEAADKTFAFKEGVREICENKGCQCYFVAIPYADASGNGCHFNHSLWDEAGKNVFQDEADENNFSQLGRYWLGGLLKHGGALAALCAPTVNCYRRMHTTFCPDKMNWDFDNREVSIRVKSNEVGSHSKGTYIENRYGSACCNPYLILAATVAAGIDGIKNKMEPPPPGDPSMQKSDVPRTLTEALNALEADTAMCTTLGEQFSRWFLQSKRELDLVELATSDVSKMDEKAIATERDFYKFM